MPPQGVLFICIFSFCFCLSHTFKCFNMPAFPLYGRLEAHGSFTLTLVCPEPDQDIPLNSPGDNGIMSCDAQTPNHELAEMHIPGCLPTRYARAVFLPFLFVFVADACVRNLNDAIEKFRNEHFPKLGNPDGLVRESNWSQTVDTCGINSSGADGKAVQIDVQFSLKTSYTKQFNFTRFVGELEAFREKTLEVLSSELLGVWKLDSTDITAYEVGFWTADCEGLLGAKGSIISKNMVASCRGCSESFYFEALQNKCVQCDFNLYTEKPYAEDCTPCPPEAMWGSNKAKMLNLCFGRL